MKHGVAARGAVGVVAALALCACGGSGGDDPKGAGSGGKASAETSATPSERIRHVEAPKRFSTDRAVALPESAGEGNVAIAGVQHPLPIALDKGVVYIARPDGLEIVSGYVPSDPILITPEREPLARLDDLGPFVGGNTARRPLVTEHGGKTLVLAALVGRVPGAGTTKGHDALELMAADAAQGTKAWSVEIPLAEGHYSVEEGQSEVVGRSGRVVVVMGHGQLFGVDLDSRRKVWSAPGDFQEGAVVAGGTVVGLRLDEDGTDRRVVGLDPATGEERWSESGVAAERLSAAEPEDGGGERLRGRRGRRRAPAGRGLRQGGAAVPRGLGDRRHLPLRRRLHHRVHGRRSGRRLRRRDRPGAVGAARRGRHPHRPRGDAGARGPGVRHHRRERPGRRGRRHRRGRGDPAGDRALRH
ncbi:PQQ-binding-like beta-propeller repeat protein [Streptomyces sp. UP1A-1]|nr:PQQ-binding-like beta-propeller repeat protein [Streptomyces sp. UP1A-1]